VAALLVAPGFPVWATLGLGLALGLRHALDADHLAAVSTLVSEGRNIWRSAAVGLFWGLGHTAALLAFGTAIAMFRLTVSEPLSQLMELGVAVMLVFLGTRALLRLRRQVVLHEHSHEHPRVAHTHLHVHIGNERHLHPSHVASAAGRPFVVGVIHGLAGTAAVMLLVVGAIPSVLLAVAYIIVFGVGSIVGMMSMSLLLGLPLALAARRLALAERLIQLSAALFSLCLGVLLAWENGLIRHVW